MVLHFLALLGILTGHLLAISAYAARVCPPAELAMICIPASPEFAAVLARVISGTTACPVVHAGANGMWSAL